MGYRRRLLKGVVSAGRFVVVAADLKIVLRDDASAEVVLEPLRGARRSSVVFQK
jgi:hypothetical protein